MVQVGCSTGSHTSFSWITDETDIGNYRRSLEIAVHDGRPAIQRITILQPTGRGSRLLYGLRHVRLRKRELGSSAHAATTRGDRTLDWYSRSVTGFVSVRPDS